MASNIQAGAVKTYLYSTASSAYTYGLFSLGKLYLAPKGLPVLEAAAEKKDLSRFSTTDLNIAHLGLETALSRAGSGKGPLDLRRNLIKVKEVFSLIDTEIKRRR